MMATIEQQRGGNPASEPQQHQEQQHQVQQHQVQQHQVQQHQEQQQQLNNEEQASWLMPPPQTPAVQFYAHSSSSSKNGSTGSHSNSNHYNHNNSHTVKRGGDNHHHIKSHPAASSSLHPAMDYPLAGSTSQSSSSSSLSSMAATLVSGVISPRMLPPPPGPHHQPTTHHGTAQPHHQQQVPKSSFFGGFGFGQQQHHHSAAYPVNNNPNAESPISPAQMFDGALENLFLPQSEQHLPFALCEPPPSRTTTTAATDLHLTTNNNTTNNSSNNSSSSTNNHNMGPPEPRMSAATAAASITAAISGSSNAHHDSSNNNNSWPQPILPYSNLYLHPHLLNTVASLSRPTVPETEEKRAIRLERNRMSARRSRRKKKERLETLGAQVNDLHIVLEAERRRQIDCMVPAFEQLKLLMTAASMVEVIHATEPNNFLHRAILDFQYTQLKTLTMAPYQRFLMWLLLQDPSYFRAKEAQNKKFLKISSKQIGEQLTVQSAAIHDAQTAWPLFCFELKFSVDQEERFVAAIATHHNNNSTSGNVNTNNQDNHKKANQIQMALDTADRLCKAMGSLSHLVAKRQRQTVLTFAQRQILRQHAQERNQQKHQKDPMATAATLSSSPSTTVSPETDSSPAPCMDLSDICRSLESVLHISSVVFVENTVHGRSNNNINNTHA
jgi:hypothetical protein